MFAFAKEANIAVISKLSASIAACGFIPWLFLSGSQYAIISDMVFMGGIGGCLSCSSFSFVFMLNNSERFFSMTLVLIVIDVLEQGADFFVDAASSRKIIAIMLITVICVCMDITNNLPHPELAAAALPLVTVGIPYNFSFLAESGTPPYAFTLDVGSGELPPGMSLSSTGNLTGTPTTAGTYSFAVFVTDAANAIDIEPYTMDKQPSREEFHKQLQAAEGRGKTVPGGACGNCGACGSGVGIGIFISIFTGATPMAADSWKLANEGTARGLMAEYLGYDFVDAADVIFFDDKGEFLPDKTHEALANELAIHERRDESAQVGTAAGAADDCVCFDAVFIQRSQCFLADDALMEKYLGQNAAQYISVAFSGGGCLDGLGDGAAKASGGSRMLGQDLFAYFCGRGRGRSHRGAIGPHVAGCWCRP